METGHFHHWLSFFFTYHTSDHLLCLSPVQHCGTHKLQTHHHQCHEHAAISTYSRQCKRYNVSPSFLLLVREVIDNTGKENGIDIVMPERTYHLIADNAEDAR